MPRGLPSAAGFWAGIASIKWWLIGGLMLLIILAIGASAIYYVAYNKGENKADVEITDYQRKIQELNNRELQKEIQVRDRVIKEYHTKEIIRTRVQVVNQGVIRDRVPEQYRLSRGWVYAHDQSAQGKVIDPSRASNPTPSETSDKGALQVIDVNYDIARANKAKLDSIQRFLRETKRDVTPTVDSSTTNTASSVVRD